MDACLTNQIAHYIGSTVYPNCSEIYKYCMIGGSVYIRTRTSNFCHYIIGYLVSEKLTYPRISSLFEIIFKQ